MRLIFKILLFPVTLALTIIVLVCRFLCDFSTIVLSIISGLIFLLGLGTMILLKEPADGFGILILAYVISPYGLPLLASWLVERLDDLNCLIKSI